MQNQPNRRLSRQDQSRATKASPVRSKSPEKSVTSEVSTSAVRNGTTKLPINHDILALSKENKKLRKYLQSIINVIKWFDNRLSAEMNLPPSYERGRRIARLTNALNYAMESAEYHGLGVDYRKAKDLTEGQRVTLDKQFEQIAEFNRKLKDDLAHYERMGKVGNSRYEYQ